MTAVALAIVTSFAFKATIATVILATVIEPHTGPVWRFFGMDDGSAG